MKNEFLIAITQLSAEKNLPKEVVFEAVEAALASAYKKDTNAGANISVKIDPNTGAVHVYTEKVVVEEVTDPKLEIGLEEARRIRPDAQVGETVAIETPMANSGRIAAQTAKQVVLQRLREAEREVVYEEYSDKEGDIVSGVVQRVDSRQVIIDLGKTEAVLPPQEQVRTEHYRPGQRLKVYVLEVFRAPKGPQVTVSRTHKNLIRRLFELEVPEIYRGVVEIKAIAREAGYRSKVAVASNQEGVDPVGACVGLRGIRIQNVVNELNGERIDVILWDPEPARFVANALSPAQVVDVTINEAENTAYVVVPDRQLSLAIGKEGQNARLAAKLTGWRIDIRSQSAAEAEREALGGEPAAAVAEPEPQPEPEPVPAAPTAEAAPAEPLTPEEEAVAAFQEAPEPAAEAPEPVAAEPEPLPAAVEGPQIRFAEDVLPSAGGKKKARGKRNEREEEPDIEVLAKPKKAKKARRPVIEEDDELDEYEEYLSRR
ncbi:MAG TPA: transcription termination factor NusA [Dehalococcoidia bacterium]